MTNTLILECVQSFGENCQYPCHEFCVNQTCDRINGRCLYGCKDEKKCYECMSFSYHILVVVDYK